MERAKRIYSLVRRKASKPKCFIWYVKFRDDEGTYRIPASSGETNKTCAMSWADRQLLDGTYRTTPAHDQTFAETGAGFRHYESSAYIRARLARGKTFSRALASDRSGYVSHGLLPTFGEKPLATIKHHTLERFFMVLHTSGRMAGTDEVGGAGIDTQRRYRAADNIGAIAVDTSECVWYTRGGGS